MSEEASLSAFDGSHENRRHSSDSLIDPEPFATTLLVLGSLGSIASLLGYFEMRYSEYKEEREFNRFAIRDAIMGAETSLNEVRALTRSAEVAFATGSRESQSFSDEGRAIAKFGSVRLIFSPEGFGRWSEIEHSILVTTSQLHRHLNRLLSFLRHLSSRCQRMSRCGCRTRLTK